MKGILLKIVFPAWVLVACFIGFVIAPIAAFAQDGPPETFAALVNRMIAIANVLLPVIVALTVLAFIWGVFRYITAGGDEKKLGEAKRVVLYGLIAIALMLTFWGFVILGRSILYPTL